MLLERRMEERRQTIGVLAATIVNSSGFRSKDAEDVTPLTFFPDHRNSQPGSQQTPDDHERILKALLGRRLTDKRKQT